MPPIRPATIDDAEAIHAIYHHYILHETCTYQIEPEPLEQRVAWLRDRGERHPVFVAERGGRVIGWASLSPFNGRCAYERTAEVSIYLAHDQRGRGIGTQLLQRLIDAAREHGHHTLIAGASAEQTASLALHQRFGFQRVAHFREVGYKFDRWLDVIYLQLMLEPDGP